MNILPQQLIGKVVKDCYQDRDGDVVIEFTDGTKVQLIHYESKDEVYIPTIL